jgi:hypothetical protein
VSHAGASALQQLVQYRRVGGCGWLPEFGRRGCKSRLFRASADLGSVRRSHAGACPVYTWLSLSQLTQPPCASASRFRRAGQLWFGRSGWSGWSVSNTNTHNSSPPKGCPGPPEAAHALPVLLREHWRAQSHTQCPVEGRPRTGHVPRYVYMCTYSHGGRIVMVDVPSWLRRPPRIWLSDVYLRLPTDRPSAPRTH